MNYTSPKFPAEIVITNLLKEGKKLEFPVWNQGLDAANGGDALSAQDAFVYNESNAVKVPVYGNKNQYFEIPAEGVMKVTAQSDAEALFYLSFAKDEVLSVKVTPSV